MHEGIDTRYYQYVLVIAEEGNFLRAANRLHLSQPTLSHHIKTLEQRIDVQLFIRTHKWTRITPAGDAFVRLAKKILNTQTLALAEVRAAHTGQTLPFRLGYCSFINLETLAVARRLYTEHFPDGNLQFIASDLSRITAQLLDGELDAALITPPMDEQGLTIHRLFRERLMFCLHASHPLATKSTISWKDLATERWVCHMRKLHPALCETLLRKLKRAGFTLSHCTEVASLEEALFSVREGFGLTFVRESTLLPTDLILRSASELELHVEMALVYQKGRQWEPISRLANALALHYAPKRPVQSVPRQRLIKTGTTGQLSLLSD
jgi:DNA-binding transcriptional LysR family regulator